MTVRELLDHFLSHATWVDPKKTADAIEVGDPDREVRKIGTGWTACAGNLRAAGEDGCDLFITHEPSFCEFWDPALRFRESAWGRARVRTLDQYGMALMALHDTWDFWPDYGIGDSWRAFLGLPKPVNSLSYAYQLNPSHHSPRPSLTLHEIAPTTAAAFAGQLAARTREFGMEGVAFMGNGEAVVRRVAVGVGCNIPAFEMLGAGADLLVQVFDRAFQTITRIPLIELGGNLIVVEHGIAEMPGMRRMADYLNDHIPGVNARFYRNEPDTQWILPPAGPAAFPNT